MSRRTRLCDTLSSPPALSCAVTVTCPRFTKYRPHYAGVGRGSASVPTMPPGKPLAIFSATVVIWQRTAIIRGRDDCTTVSDSSGIQQDVANMLQQQLVMFFFAFFCFCFAKAFQRAPYLAEMSSLQKKQALRRNDAKACCIYSSSTAHALL